jgi:glycolate oxidase iron-sulfur subunit
VLATLPYPRRFRAALVAGGLALPLPRFLPARLRGMLELLPDACRAPSRCRRGRRRWARGGRGSRCSPAARSRVLAPEIHAATLRVLAQQRRRGGGPRAAVAAAARSRRTPGRRARRRASRARTLAPSPARRRRDRHERRRLRLGPARVPARGCGQPEEEAARAVASRSVDVSASSPSWAWRRRRRSCATARRLPRRLPPRARAGRDGAAARAATAGGGDRAARAERAELCCGSAGTYNLEHPGVAHALGQRRAATVRAADPDVVASGNIGCITQLRSHLRAAGAPVPVLHTVQVLDLAYRGRLEASARPDGA